MMMIWWNGTAFGMGLVRVRIIHWLLDAHIWLNASGMYTRPCIIVSCAPSWSLDLDR